MNVDWRAKKLEEACTFTNGLWKGESPPFVKVGVFRNTNFTKDGFLDESDVAFLEVEQRQFATRRLTRGDIILEKSGGGPKQPVGRVALFDREDGAFSFSNFTAAIRVKDPRELDYRFLHKYLYWLHLSGVTEQMQSHSTGIRNLDGDAYKNLAVPLPPIPEQQRIAELLDEALQGIATAKASLDVATLKARELFRSFRESVLSRPDGYWDTVPLARLATNLDSKRVPITKKDRVAGEYPYFGASGVVDYVSDYIFEGDALLVSEDGANLLARTTPIAFSVSGKYWVNNHAHVLRFNHLATQRYVESYLESIGLEAYVTGAAQPKLTQKALNTIPIRIPRDVGRQAEIVGALDEFASETGQLVSTYGRKTDLLHELKTSLLDNAFRGLL